MMRHALRYALRMTAQLAIRIPDDELSRLDAMVAAGAYPTRTSAILAAVRRLLADAREDEIEAAYRRGYGESPQEEWVGEPGLVAFAALAETDPDGEAL